MLQIYQHCRLGAYRRVRVIVCVCAGIRDKNDNITPKKKNQSTQTLVPNVRTCIRCTVRGNTTPIVCTTEHSRLVHIYVCWSVRHVAAGTGAPVELLISQTHTHTHTPGTCRVIFCD